MLALPNKYRTITFMGPTYLHVYNRGIDRREVFENADDYDHMINLLERYLGPQVRRNEFNSVYPNYSGRMELLAFCLMPNHFHLMLQTQDLETSTKFMQSLKTSYCKYFNAQHGRSGYVFESRYHKRLVDAESDYLHLSRYIHLNALALTPRYQNYAYSSLQYYLNDNAPSWLTTNQVLSSFSSFDEYRQFHEDYIRQLATDSILAGSSI